MKQSSAVEIRFSALLGWVIPLSAAVGGFGAYPTWMVAGVIGLWAQAASGACVLVVMVFNGWVTVRVAALGPAKVAVAFSASSFVRLLLCPLLVWIVSEVVGLPYDVMFIWLVIFYLTSLAAECVWVVKALRRHSRRVKAGEIAPNRPSP